MTIDGLLMVIAGSALATSAYGQQAPANPDAQPIMVTGTQPAKKTPDPNEVVCEKQQDTSSRLVSHKVCMTRSEWSEQRRLDRQEIDKAQTLRPM
jgi:hypothetical protein